MQEEGAVCTGKAVTLQMVNKWVAKVTKVRDLLLSIYFRMCVRCHSDWERDAQRG